MFFVENKQLFKVVHLEEHPGSDHKIVTAQKWTGMSLGPQALTGLDIIRFPKKCNGRCHLCQTSDLAG